MAQIGIDSDRVIDSDAVSGEIPVNSSSHHRTVCPDRPQLTSQKICERKVDVVHSGVAEFVVEEKRNRTLVATIFIRNRPPVMMAMARIELTGEEERRACTQASLQSAGWTSQILTTSSSWELVKTKK